LVFADDERKKAVMIGFPDYSSQKWIDLLVENNYTIIRIN
jgi:DNA mismatch repair ATPase MutS